MTRRMFESKKLRRASWLLGTRVRLLSGSRVGGRSGSRQRVPEDSIVESSRLREAGDPVGALAVLEGQEGLDNDPVALTSLALAKHMMGDATGALAAVDVVDGLLQRMCWSAAVNRATFLKAARRFEEAADAAEKAIGLLPGDPVGHLAAIAVAEAAGADHGKVVEVVKRMDLAAPHWREDGRVWSDLLTDADYMRLHDKGVFEDVFGESAADIAGPGCWGSADVYTPFFEERAIQSVESERYVCSADERNAFSVGTADCLSIVRRNLWRQFAFSSGSIQDGCSQGRTFTHEIGHNLGLLHDRHTTGDGRAVRSLPIRPYGFGYVNQDFGRTKCLKTIMAYANQCFDEGYSGRSIITELMFSNPKLQMGNEEDGFARAGVPGEEQTGDLDGPVDASRAIDDVWDIVSNLYRLTDVGHAVPFLPAAGGAGRQSAVHIVNHAPVAGEVAVVAFDDAGNSYGPITLAIDAYATLRFDAVDLETGDPAKGLPNGIGPGEGDWHLKLTSLLDIEVLAYLHAPDGLLAPTHDLMPPTGPGRRAPIVLSGSTTDQTAFLRVINPRDEEAWVTITGIDDIGQAGDEVRALIPAHGAQTFPATELEAGSARLDGALGHGTGAWRLFVEAVGLTSDRPASPAATVYGRRSPLDHRSVVDETHPVGSAIHPTWGDSRPRRWPTRRVHSTFALVRSKKGSPSRLLPKSAHPVERLDAKLYPSARTARYNLSKTGRGTQLRVENTPYAPTCRRATPYGGPCRPVRRRERNGPPKYR